jgi:hypothetical protein
MAAPHDRRKDHDDEDESTTAWSSPRPSPGAMGAAHDDLFGVPSAAPKEPDSDADSDEGDAETDVEGDAAQGRDSAAGDDDDGTAHRGEKNGRSVGADETEVEGRAGGATDPDGDGSRTSTAHR